MEREVFEDEQVAELLNKKYVSIKVDREERPDIDSIYMSFCHAYTGSGGWPLTIVMTADKEPFFAGTFFPKFGRYGMPGIMKILSAISDKWNKDKDDLIKSGDKLKKVVEMLEGVHDKEAMNESVIHEAFKELKVSFEPNYGGFSYAPKFPSPHNILFLFRYYYFINDESALFMAEKTLESMYKGGIFDHIGYGFSRYSTDNKWLVPHFEKMLYDNALLSMAYSEAYAITKKELYREIAEKIYKYILEKMTSLEGGFYCAEDADSEGVEGKFYVWDKLEITEALNHEEAAEFSKLYDISEEGNFEGKSVPNLIKKDLQELSEDKALENRMNKIIERLSIYREKRIHPFKDDKVLTGWNGLMIASLAIGGRLLSAKKYINAAEKASSFIFENLINEKGRLLGRYRDGEAANLAFLDDYAFLVWGLIELYQSTFNISYLKKAVELNKDMISLFQDKSGDGFYLYGEDSEKLIFRPKEIYDGAMPSGNSVAAINLVRLSHITGDRKLKDIVERMYNSFGGTVYQNPAAYIGFVTAYMYSIIPNTEVVIVGEKEDLGVKSMLEEVNNRFLPFSSLIINNGENDILNIIPHIMHCKKISSKATAYVCQNYKCNEPTIDLSRFKELIRENKHSLTLS